MLVWDVLSLYVCFVCVFFCVCALCMCVVSLSVFGTSRSVRCSVSVSDSLAR